MSLLENFFGSNNPASEERQNEFSNSILKTQPQLMNNLFITSKKWR
jgi:hypothetical protein